MKACIFAIALALPSVPFAQDMKGMDMKDQKCADMKDPKCMGMMKDHKGMDMKGMKSDAKGDQGHKATGKVSKIDPAAGTVTIAHEPVPSMKWPSMTMAFKVKDKALLERAKPGAKVDFSFTQSGKDYVITDIK
jgi:Cu(I)/Ag(I) efflux system periplasmic protein CusF